MNIGILSGKGGTGKTTVSTNLAVIMNANYVDGDVEEPNGFIFLQPKDINSTDVQVEYPSIDKDKCTFCGECAKVCQFNSLFITDKDTFFFSKLCHGCGACKIACKYDAIEYKLRTTGVIEEGTYENIKVKRGLLNIGEPMAVPVIKQLLSNLEEGTNVIDFPPGTSCNVVNSLNYVDKAILVTEPTEFGLHDLKMAVEVTRMSKVPFGIIINKHLKEETRIHDYCKKEGIPIIGEIPYDMDIVRLYSHGHLLLEDERFRKIFSSIVSKIQEVV